MIQMIAKTKIQVQDGSSLSKMQDVEIKIEMPKTKITRTKMKFKIAGETTSSLFGTLAV